MFEALAFRYKLQFTGVPPQWLPLFFCFDPDLPLFPI